MINKYDEFGRVELSTKEREDIDNLPKNYYRIKEDPSDYDYIASRRLVISKTWGGKLLTMAFIMNIISSLLVIFSIVVLLIKPDPVYYGTTPSGFVVPLKQFS